MCNQLLMNESVIALENFINSFALKQADGIVYFYADIEFIIDGHAHTLSGDIHIITSDNLATVYILGLDTRPWELPDMFTPAKDDFSYIDKVCLQITAKAETRKYCVRISPKAIENF